MQTVADEMRVWVGCLACYNDGRLQGEWTDALEASDCVPCTMPGHEEFWCMDLEGFPAGTGEMSPAEAQEMAEEWQNVPEWQGDAARIYVASGYDLDDFDEAYCGEYDDEEDYATNLADDIGLLSEVSEAIRSYFDYESFARDLFMSDYWSAPTGGRGIYVFRAV